MCDVFYGQSVTWYCNALSCWLYSDQHSSHVNTRLIFISLYNTRGDGFSRDGTDGHCCMKNIPQNISRCSFIAFCAGCGATINNILIIIHLFLNDVFLQSNLLLLQLLLLLPYCRLLLTIYFYFYQLFVVVFFRSCLFLAVPGNEHTPAVARACPPVRCATCRHTFYLETLGSVFLMLLSPLFVRVEGHPRCAVHPVRYVSPSLRFSTMIADLLCKSVCLICRLFFIYCVTLCNMAVNVTL